MGVLIQGLEVVNPIYYVESKDRASNNMSQTEKGPPKNSPMPEKAPPPRPEDVPQSPEELPPFPKKEKPEIPSLPPFPEETPQPPQELPPFPTEIPPSPVPPTIPSAQSKQ